MIDWWIKVKIGFWIALSLATALVAGYLKARQDGKLAAAAERAKANAEAAAKRRKVDDNVENMPHGDVNTGIRDWLRDGKR